MKAITYEQARLDGIDTSTIAVCERVRRLAKLDRIQLDMSKPQRSLNKHLFTYLDYCGLDKSEFIKEYLSNLQPYMIERRKDQESVNTFICVIDNLYRISVYIKLDSKQFEELIVSFHEDNKRGIAKDNTSVIKTAVGNVVPVFADSIESMSEDLDNCIIKVFVQRGLKVLPITLPGLKCEKVYLVRRQTIEQNFIEYCNEYIRQLYTSDLPLDDSFDSIDVFSTLQQISFTSYGRDIFSSLSLLIDSLLIQPDAISKQAADFALITFAQNLKLDKDQHDDLKSLLYDKYSVTSKREISSVLDRVSENLALRFIANHFNTENVIDVNIF